jgi:hypothetical protein
VYSTEDRAGTKVTILFVLMEGFKWSSLLLEIQSKAINKSFHSLSADQCCLAHVRPPFPKQPRPFKALLRTGRSSTSKLATLSGNPGSCKSSCETKTTPSTTHNRTSSDVTPVPSSLPLHERVSFSIDLIPALTPALLQGTSLLKQRVSPSMISSGTSVLPRC